MSASLTQLPYVSTTGRGQPCEAAKRLAVTALRLAAVAPVPCHCMIDIDQSQLVN